MKVSSLIARLQHLQKEHGDMDVFMDVSPNRLVKIGEIDVDADDTGIMLWPKEDYTPLS